MDRSVANYLISLGLDPTNFEVINKTSDNIRLVEAQTRKVLDIRF